MKRSRRASAVACDVLRAGPVLPVTRSPSTKQTSIRAALAGSTPAASSPAAFARASAPATLASMALKKLPMRPSTSGSWPANSMAVATSRHPRRPWRRSCGRRNRQGRSAGHQLARGAVRARRLSEPGRRRYSDRAHEGRARACPRKRRKGCRAKASSLEAGLAARCRDSRVTRTQPWHARQRLPCRSYGAGHAATALGFGASQARIWTIQS